MSELVFASRMMREVIAPPGIAGGKGERIREAARKLHWKYSRAVSVWYGDERVSIKPRELREIEEISGVRYGREELREVEQLISRADALLGGADANVLRALVAALRDVVGGTHRPGAEG